MKPNRLCMSLTVASLLCLGWLFAMLNNRPNSLKISIENSTHHWKQQRSRNNGSIDRIGKSSNSSSRAINLKVNQTVKPELVRKADPMRQGLAVTPMLHQSWKSRQLPKRAQRWSATWKKCFPNWEYRLWTDEDNLALVRDHYPWFLPVFLGFAKPVERADLARYFYMYHFGGVYTDLDNVCVRSFEHLLNSTGMLFGGMDGLNDGDDLLHTYVQNSFMASRPGHPFWLPLIGRVMILRHFGRSGRPEYITGPYMLMDELRDYMRNKPTDTKIYMGKYFNPFTWYYNKVKPCKDLGRMTDADESKCIASFPDAYVVQFHTQTWLHGHI